MKKIGLMLSLFVLALFLVSCKETPPMPPGVPEAGAPIGSALAGLLTGQTNWATDPTGTGRPFSLAVNEPKNSIFNLRPNPQDRQGQGELRFFIDAPIDSYILRYFWTCGLSCDINNISSYRGFELRGDSANIYTQHWFKFETAGRADGQFRVDRANYKLGENYIAAYACKRLGRGRWDCNNDGVEDNSQNGPKFMLQTFKVYPTCEDDETTEPRNSQNFFIRGKVLGVNSAGEVIDDSDNCTSNLIVKEYYCISGKDVGALPVPIDYEVITSAIRQCNNQTTQAVCLYGACTTLPPIREEINFSHFSSPSRLGEEEMRGVVVPAKIQLSTTQDVPLSIAVNHDLIQRQFFFGKEASNGSVYSFRESPTLGNWIIKNATQTITLDDRGTVIDQENYLKGLKLNLGLNVLYTHACDKTENTDKVRCRIYGQNVNILPSCIDADESNQSVKGNTYGIEENGQTYISGRPDECVNTQVHQSVVREYYCEAGTDNFIYVKNREIACGEGNICFNGKCEPAEVPCMDSDNGQVYTTRGSFTGNYNETGTYISNQDECLDPNDNWDEVPSSPWLGEGYCEGGLLKIEKHQCTCVNGVCS